MLVGLGLDQDSGVPYAPFADAWAQSPQSERCARTIPTRFCRSRHRAVRRRKTGSGCFSPLSDRSRRSPTTEPVCLVVENLHQADQSSLHLFHHLAHTTRTLALLLVGTLREEEVHVGHGLHTLLGALARERMATRIVLSRLDLEATGQLVAEMTEAAPPREVVAAVYALAEGNPFHTEEVVQAMREDGSTRPSVPANLLETVRHRVRRIGRDAERLLLAAAIVGHRFSFEVARRAAGLAPEPALDALEAASKPDSSRKKAGEVSVPSRVDAAGAARCADQRASGLSSPCGRRGDREPR